MYNIIQIQDRLKDVSDQYLQGLATRPTDDVPPFLVLSELKRRSDSKKAQEVRQAQDMSTVLEDQVAMQGMPVDEASAMAQVMNPNTDTGMNTGRDEGLMAMKRASSIPSEVMSVEDEDVRGMRGGGLAERVSPRPDDTGKFEGLMGKFFGPAMGSIDLAAKWDAQFGMYYNPDGTIKDQYRDLVGGTATQATTDADDQLPSVKDAQRMMDINEIPSVPKETDDADDDDDDDGTGSPTGFLADIKRSLAEMKEEAKDQKKRDEGLALIQAGLAVSKRGDISEASEGIKTLQAQTKAAKDRELTAAGLGAKIGIAEATIGQRAAAAKLAAQKALTKSSLTDAQALANYRMATETIDKLNKTLNDLTNPLSEEDKIKALERKAYFENVVDILGARVKGILGADIIDVAPKAGTS